mgnify:CR=1 FL=1
MPTKSSEKQVPGLTHLDKQGNMRMVDVGGKVSTRRVAVAEAKVLLGEDTRRSLESGIEKWDVLAAARYSGITAAKKTSDLIPLCHPLSLSFVSTFLKAENLEEVYELALKNDPLLKAAEASYRAGKENKVQGRSGLLPNLSVSGSTNWNEYRVMDQIIDQYNSNNYSARLTQPVFRMDKWFQFRRGKALTQSAEAEFAYQQQETMIRVASAYFNVLNSIDSLNAARAEEKAIGRQKDLAKKRFGLYNKINSKTGG